MRLECQGCPFEGYGCEDNPLIDCLFDEDDLAIERERNAGERAHWDESKIAGVKR